MIIPRTTTSWATPLALALPLAVQACGESTSTQDDPSEAALLDVKEYIATELAGLAAAVQALCDAAPAPDADGWNAVDDADAVAVMRQQWSAARVHYERVEGAIAVLFPDLDASTDERYDGFVEEAPDDDLFDAHGATGVHAIERILWAGEHPPAVVAFESGLAGYVEAAFPQDEEEAAGFRDELCQRLATDTATMQSEFAPLALDTATAFRGVVGSLEEQREKVTLGSTGADESRYSQATLADMRANLEGAKAVYAAFRTWVQSASDGDALDQDVMEGFARLEAAYAAHTGDALPEVPASWSDLAPTTTDLATPYGQLWSLVSAESDADDPQSLVAALNRAGDALGIPRLP